MKKIFYFVVIALIITCNLCAENANFTHLAVYTRGQEETLYELDERPAITFNEQSLLIKSHSMEISYPLADVVKYTFINQPTMSNITSISAGYKVAYIEGNIVLENVLNDQTIQLYTVKGELLKSYPIHKGESTTISLNEYSDGVYLLQIGNVTYKMKK